MIDKMVKVKILSQGRIPFLGSNGPILKPISIQESIAKNLISLGFDVEIVDEIVPMKLEEVKKEIIVEVKKEVEVPVEEVKEEPKVEEVIEETPEMEEEIVEEAEEIMEEEEVEEIEEETTEEVFENVVENDRRLSPSSFYTYDFLNKKKCIKILTDRELEFDPNDNAENLKQLVLDSNPEVQ